MSRKLHSGESPDVYLAELWRLASLFGGLNDKALACAFVEGLPEDIRQPLRAGSRMEALDLNQILSRARAVIRDDSPFGSSEACLRATASYGATTCVAAAKQRCYMCGGLNHLARDCLAHQPGHGCTRRQIRCYQCGGLGHIASECLGNEQGEGASVPASSHVSQ